MAVQEVVNEVFLVDTFDLGIPNRTAGYLIRDERCALIDPGSANNREHVIRRSQEIGLREDNLHYIILTHIHVDHAGGAGWLLECFPRAQVIVHPKGASYLVNPKELRSSTKKARLEYPFHPCEFLAIDAEKIVTAEDGQKLFLGKRTLTFLDTPGHAPHCFCIHDSLTNGIFVGDSLGIKIDCLLDNKKCEIFLPAMVPPRFEPKDALLTTEKLARLNPDRFYYTHFGVTTETERLIAKYRAAVEKSLEIAENLKRKKVNQETAFDYLYKWLLNEVLEIPRENLENITVPMKISLELNIAGLLGYIFKK